ncbi:MAG TPA: hypothetical protein VK612_03485, partial [Pyrinomonadaceae bacterium]|nr:hypothetical protein [Pyrinomonadaceae bacterium]
DYVREHMEATSTVDFVPIMPAINASYDEGSVESLKMHDGSVIQLRKLAKDWDPLDRLSAINAMQNSRAKSEILTGLLYMNADSQDLHHLLETTEKPLNTLTKSDLCPGSEELNKINDALR